MMIFYSNYLKGIGSEGKFNRELGLTNGFGLFRIKHLSKKISNIELYDILSRRFGLSLFDDDEEYRVYPQNNDIFDHHYLNYNMIGKIILHNLI